MTAFLRTPALLQVVALLAPAARTASANGTGVDLVDYEGTMKAILDSGAGGSGATMDVKLQDSADNSSFADITGATFTQVGNAASAGQKIDVDVSTVRRYVRAVVTIAGTASFASCLNLVGFKKAQ